MWGKSFVIDNRGGAGGTIGEAVAAKSDPDGYTMLLRRHRVLGEPGALSQAVVRLRQGFRAGVPGFARAQHPGGDAVGRGEDHGRHHRACEEDAGRPRLRLVGQRHAAASLPGAAEVHGQGADQPHPLSRRRAGAERRGRGAGEVFLLQRLVVGRPGAGRQGQGDRPHRQGPARHACPICRRCRTPSRASRPTNGTACSCRPARRRRSSRSSTPD